MEKRTTPRARYQSGLMVTGGLLVRSDAPAGPAVDTDAGSDPEPAVRARRRPGRRPAHRGRTVRRQPRGGRGGPPGIDVPPLGRTGGRRASTTAPTTAMTRRAAVASKGNR